MTDQPIFIDPNITELQKNYDDVAMKLKNGEDDPQKLQTLMYSLRVLHSIIRARNVENPPNRDIYIEDMLELSDRLRLSQRDGINMHAARDIAFEMWDRMNEYIEEQGLLRINIKPKKDNYKKEEEKYGVNRTSIGR